MEVSAASTVVLICLYLGTRHKGNAEGGIPAVSTRADAILICADIVRIRVRFPARMAQLATVETVALCIFIEYHSMRRFDVGIPARRERMQARAASGLSAASVTGASLGSVSGVLSVRVKRDVVPFRTCLPTKISVA